MKAGLLVFGTLTLWILSASVVHFDSIVVDRSVLYLPAEWGGGRRLVNNAFPFFAEIGSNDIRLTQSGQDGDISYIASTPDVAFNDAAGQYLVVWAGSIAGDQEIYARLFDQDGAALTAPLKVSDMGPVGNVNYDANAPAVVYNASLDRYLVAWQGDDVTNDEFEIYVQEISVTGSPGSLSLVEVGTDDMQVSTVGVDGAVTSSAFAPDVAYDHETNRFLVVWYADHGVTPLVDNEYEIFGQLLTYVSGVLGEPAAEFRISDMGGTGNTIYNAFDPRVVYNAASDEYLVVWHGDDNIAPLVDNEFEIFGQRISNSGTEAGTGNDFRISSTGPNGSTSYRASRAAVACNSQNGQYLVVWEGDDDTTPLVDNENEIFGQLLTSLGAATGPDDFRISDMGVDGNVTFAAQFAEVAYNSVLNQYFVVWEGDNTTDGEMEIYGRSVDVNGVLVGVDERISDAGPDGDINYNATSGSVAYNPSRVEYFVVWRMDDNTGSLIDNEYEVYGQLFAQLDDEPGAQPTSPVVSDLTPNGLTLTFTAASGPPDGYLVLRRAGSSPTEVPADHTVYTAGSILGSSTVVHVGDAVTFDQSGLSANTTYYYDLFSYNGVESSTNYRTTSPLEVNATTLATEPGTQASGISFTTVGTTSVTFNITNGNGASRLVVGRAGAAVNAFPQDGNAYTANNTFGSGSHLGSNNYVVASGNGPVTVTGLSTATTYHFRVFEFNGTGAQTNYKTSTATNNPSSISTLSSQPGNQPTSLAFTDVTSTSMKGSFTAAAGSPSGYLVLRKAGSSPTDVPVDGQSYAAGAMIGSSEVVSSAAGTTFVSDNLSAATEYYYDVFAFNGSGSNTNYLTTSPLQGNRVTYATEPVSQPTALTFSAISPDAMDGSFTSAAGNPDGYLVLRRVGTSPAEVPEDGTTYTVGSNFGSSYVVAAGSATNFSSTGLSGETAYFYDVFAFNGSGATVNYLSLSPLEGSRSTVAQEPGSGVSDIIFSEHTTSSFTVEFTGVASVDGYLVVRKEGGQPIGVPVDGTIYVAGSSTLAGDPVMYTGATPSFAESGLSPGNEYHYAIFPFKGSGEGVNYHTSGTDNKASTMTLPEMPALDAATDIGQTSFTIHWSAVSGAAGYQLDVSTDNFATRISGYDGKSVSGTSETIAVLDAGTTYQYRVRAVNAIGGFSTYSDPPGVQLTVPPTPADVAITDVQQTQFSISWTASQSATDYLLYVSATAAFDSPLSGYGPKVLTGTSETVAGLTAGNTYYVKLQSRNGGGGPASPTTDPVAQLMKPATPIGLEPLNPTPNSFKAKWEGANGATSYEIDVSLQNDFSSHVSGYPKNVGNLLEETVGGLPPVTIYYYAVRAKNDTGYSPYGNMVSASTTAAGGSSLAVTDPLTFGPVLPIHVTSAQVTAQITGGTGDKTATLFHRPITSTNAYSSTAMTTSGGTNWSVSLPASAFDELGLEFYVRAEDASGTDQSETYYIYKGITSESNQSIPFSPGFNGNTNTYQMFSIPYELVDRDVENLFDVALGGYDNTRWRIFHYQGGSYREYPRQFVEVRLGEGYWFNTVVQDFQINVGEGSAAQATKTTPFNKSLEAGWNQIGNPFPFNVLWDAVRGSDGKIGRLWVFRNGAYDPSDVFEPWAGAFVHADEAMTLSFPVSAKTTSSGRERRDEMNSDLNATQWMVPITLRIGSLQQLSGVGMHPQANESKDRFDEITLPRFADYAEMKSYHSEFFSHDFSIDVVPTKEDQEWMFEIESNLDGAQGSITWDHASIAGGRSSLVLIDITDGKWLDMRTTGSYTFTHRPGRQIKIVYNREGEINPGITLLGEVYPNPFNEVVHIPLLIAEPGSRQIEIYDGFGRIVKKLGAHFESSGLHEVIWNIKDDHPNWTASGMLYFRLTGDSRNRVTRVIKH